MLIFKNITMLVSNNLGFIKINFYDIARILSQAWPSYVIKTSLGLWKLIKFLNTEDNLMFRKVDLEIEYPEIKRFILLLS